MFNSCLRVCCQCLSIFSFLSGVGSSGHDAESESSGGDPFGTLQGSTLRQRPVIATARLREATVPRFLSLRPRPHHGSASGEYDGCCWFLYFLFYLTSYFWDTLFVCTLKVLLIFVSLTLKCSVDTGGEFLPTKTLELFLPSSFIFTVLCQVNVKRWSVYLHYNFFKFFLIVDLRSSIFLKYIIYYFMV